MENPDIVQALLYIFAAAALGGLLVWLLLRLQLKDWQSRFLEQAALLEKSQDRIAKIQTDLDESQSALVAQRSSMDEYEEQKAKWNAADKIHAAEKRALGEWKAKAEKLETELRKTRAALTEQAAYADGALDTEWQARYEKTEHSRQELQNELTEAAKREDKWHKEVLALQAQIQRLQAQNSATATLTESSEANRSHELTTAEATAEEVLKPRERSKEAVTLARIKERAKELNFERIGYSRQEDADDLKQIKGIGPSLERKLNSIGIYSFFQLANFESEDEDKINEVIEFFPGRIKRDEWVSQAKALLKQKEVK